MRILVFALALICAGAQAADSVQGLTLQAAQARAESHNRDIQAARRALEQAEAGLDVAGARPNPTLSFNTTGVNLGAGIGGGNLRDKQVDSVLRLDQPFERGQKRELRLGQAQANVDAARQDLKEIQRQQQLAVSNAYWDIRLAQDKLRIALANEQLLATLVSKSELRLKAGDIAATDLERIHIERLRVQADSRAAQNDLARARLALAQLLALEGQAQQLSAQDPWPPVQHPNDTPTTLSHLRQRPDWQAAQARLQAAEQGKQLAESLRTRDITVGVQFEHYPPNGRRMVGMGIALPLFTGYDYSGEVKQAWSAWYAAQENLERTEAGAQNELQRWNEDSRAAAERARLYQDYVLPSARKSAQAVDLAYQHGAASVLDVIDAQRTLRATENEVSAALADYARAQAGLRLALPPAPSASQE